MKLIYWIADCIRDNPVYSIRARTRKDCRAQLEAWGEGYADQYGPPRKVVIEYADAFDLALSLTCEGGGEGLASMYTIAQVARGADRPGAQDA